MQRVLVVHIDAMQRYEGFADDAIDPRRNRSHHPKDKVGERYNFKIAPGGKVYGAWCKSKVELRRIDPDIPNTADRIDKVLVIFWATFPKLKQRVVGWYKDAIVHAISQKNTANDRDQNSYIAESSTTVLLDQNQKMPKVPLAKHDLHHLGVGNHLGHWYQLNEKGKRKIEPWLEHLVNRINSFKVVGQHTRPKSVDENHVSEQAEIQFSEEQGFLSNPRLRKCIENYAVKRAIAIFEKDGYQLIEKVGKPYDLLFSKNRINIFVEVKGTQTNGSKIFMTPNEVDWSHRKHPNYHLFVLHSISIPDPKNPLPQGGVHVVKKAFRPDKNRLRAICYSYQF